MDAIMEKLAEIETTAEAIVERAEARKYEVEKEIQHKRDEFDRQLDEKTQAELARIRQAAEDKMNRIMEEQRLKNRTTIDNLKREYEENHTEYAQEILRHILEV